MKILLLLLLPLLASSQNKMTGLGKFKIDSTTVKIMDEISSAISAKINPSYDMMETAGDDSYLDHEKIKIFLLSKSDKKDEYGFPKYPDSRYIDNPAIVIYYMNYYNIADVPLEKLYLYFYKDTLYKIECKSSLELSDAMDIKYGERKIKTEEKVITCRTGLGVEYNETEKTFFQSWDINNPNIYCLALTGNYFDSKCEKSYLSSFTIYSKKTDSIVQRSLSDANKIKAKDDLEKKKSKLKDF